MLAEGREACVVRLEVRARDDQVFSKLRF